jgi:hypothetical protein
MEISLSRPEGLIRRRDDKLLLAHQLILFTLYGVCLYRASGAACLLEALAAAQVPDPCYWKSILSRFVENGGRWGEEEEPQGACA